MGAYWHLYSATGLQLEISKDKFLEQGSDPNYFIPNSFNKNEFQLLEQYEFVRESPLLPDGNRLKWNIICLKYSLREELWSLLKSFFVDVWQIIKNYNKSQLYDEFNKTIDYFIENVFTKIDITQNSLKELDNQLASMPSNYFIRYWDVPQFVVYHGWPEEVKIFSPTISGFTLFSSYEKMGIIPEDMRLLYNLKEEIVKQLQEKYKFTNYIYVMGF